MKTTCDYTLCLTSKSEEWLTVLDSIKPVLLFGTISKLNLQPTRQWSVVNSILGRICGVFSDEFTQTLRPPMLSIFRDQCLYGEKASLRFFFWRSSTIARFFLVNMESILVYAHCLGCCQANSIKTTISSGTNSGRYDITLLL